MPSTCPFLGAAALAALCLLPLPAQTLPPIEANDNRVPAGRLQDGVLHLELELRKGVWRPESEDGESIPTYAFAEAGKALQVPAPTIRVPQGSMLEIALHNTLGTSVTLHGLHSRPGDAEDVVTLEPGERKRLRFEAGEPGTYLYWGRTPDGPRGTGRVLDALLGGALVVDPPGADPTADRIFVLERWNGPTRTAINGKSWPYTERLDAEVGQPVRWKIVNASDLSHPMHLHGFHFQLEAQGDGESYQIFDENSRREEFTHSVEIMETFEITWVPKEPGRWLYHCHRMPHMRLPVPLDPADADIPEHNPDHAHMHEHDSDYAGMGGMILGITVTGPSEFDTVNDWKPGRRLEMHVGNRDGDPRFYRIALKNLDSEAPPAESTGLTGPLLVVRQGEKTEITVTNSSQKPTSVHWHGLEIESYYDGVPWWSGIGEKRAPAVEPGHEFRVKMIPQRAGSFIYHTHWHDEAQLTGGVHGPMIVLAPDEAYDPETDKSFLMSLSPRDPFGSGLLLMNGTPQPPAMRLKTGVAYRFRFMNITPTMDNLQIALRSDEGAVRWRPAAKDAVETPSHDLQEALQHVAVGETFDFEYRADGPQELRLEGWSPGNRQRVVQTLTFED
ncbi:MAG: multicopper oxidase domain-containing protein [Acidobacteria bacterium]|nr:multicopper oxidase domain-containing protein [Acidobacteriota bacterium]